MDTEENMAGIEFRTLFTQHYTCNLDKLSYGVTGSSPTNSLATLVELSTVPCTVANQQPLNLG